MKRHSRGEDEPGAILYNTANQTANKNSVLKGLALPPIRPASPSDTSLGPSEAKSASTSGLCVPARIAVVKRNYVKPQRGRSV